MSQAGLVDIDVHWEENPEMTMKHFDSTVFDVRQSVLIMAGHAQNALCSAMRSFRERDDNKANIVIDNDSLLDQLHRQVDTTAFNHLALRHPFAGNLRFVAMAMRVACNLERVGDQSVSIARNTLALNRLPPLDFTPRIDELASLAGAMLHKSLNAYVAENTLQAQEVIDADEEMDCLNRQKYYSIVDRMINDSKIITRCIHLININKCLERIADHATNIAECTLFLHTGKYVRRGDRTLEDAMKHNR